MTNKGARHEQATAKWQILLTTLTIALCSVIVFYSQAAAPDYRELLQRLVFPSYVAISALSAWTVVGSQRNFRTTLATIAWLIATVAVIELAVRVISA